MLKANHNNFFVHYGDIVMISECDSEACSPAWTTITLWSQVTNMGFGRSKVKGFPAMVPWRGRKAFLKVALEQHYTHAVAHKSGQNRITTCSSFAVLRLLSETKSINDNNKLSSSSPSISQANSPEGSHALILWIRIKFSFSFFLFSGRKMGQFFFIRILRVLLLFVGIELVVAGKMSWEKHFFFVLIN